MITHHTMLLVVLSLAVVVGAPAAGQTARTEHTVRLDDEGNRAAADFSDVDWLVGRWTGEAFGGHHEAVWQPPSAGSMTGLFKLMHDGRASMYEALWIVADGPSLALKLKHFNGDLTAWEEKDQHVTFPLVRAANDTIYFSGLTFVRLGPDAMEAFLALRQAGEDREERLTYRRVR